MTEMRQIKLIATHLGLEWLGTESVTGSQLQSSIHPVFYTHKKATRDKGFSHAAVVNFYTYSSVRPT